MMLSSAPDIRCRPVVDEDVETAEGLDRPTHELAGGRDSERSAASASAVPPAAVMDAGRLGIGGVTVVVERDGRAAIGEPDGDRPADADPGARHERAAAIEAGVIGGSGHGDSLLRPIGWVAIKYDDDPPTHAPGVTGSQPNASIRARSRGWRRASCGPCEQPPQFIGHGV